MAQQFKSMNELVEYLGRMEERIKHVEEENRTLRGSSADSNMNEVVEVLGELDRRIKRLEEENRDLRSAPAGASISNVDEHTIAKMVASFLPLTNIVHPSFLKRAFAVWGHYFVAQFIISLPFTIIYFCILVMAFSQAGQTP